MIDYQATERIQVMLDRMAAFWHMMDIFVLFGHSINQTLLLMLKKRSWKWPVITTSFPRSWVETQAPLLTHIHPALLHTGGREAETSRKLLWWLQGWWPCPAQCWRVCVAAQGLGVGSGTWVVCLAVQF